MLSRKPVWHVGYMRDDVTQDVTLLYFSLRWNRSFDSICDTSVCQDSILLW